MKAKYFVIIVLVVLLGFVVYEMMLYEDSIREEKIIEVKVEDEASPLISSLAHDELKNISINADYYFTAQGNYFQVLNTKIKNGEKVNEWDKIFLKGVNLGVAMPGKFPAEFSLSFEEYLNWFKLIGEMNANVIRIYTILPPQFYEALSYYNFNYQNKKLYLLQGVWAKEPEGNNYFNEIYTREFQKEIIKVIDLIHGNAVIEEKPGGAYGTYVSDISKYVVGILLGREWEPEAVTGTNHSNRVNSFNGEFISINNAFPMEVWLAEQMNFSVKYETQKYKSQRPISFVNWLPLDPMYHNSEIIENEKVREYDNDLEIVDFNKFNSTELFYPGIFASYHVYPYYPDYIYLEEKYRNAINNNNINENYFGYLQDLKNKNKDIPLVIAEYGLPSSRGNSHYNPFGLNQGGLNEKEQAELSLMITKDIHDTKCAGAVFFEWIDEWFKFNWLVMDFEQPQENRKNWHNMENPEQNFGIMAVESKGKVIDGKTADWQNDNFNNPEFLIDGSADATYFNLISKLPGFNLEKNNLFIAIDTYDKEKGEHKLPFLKNEIENGIEFLLEFISKDSAIILVDDKYSIFIDIYNNIIPVYTSKKNNNGKFVEQILLSNREKVTLTGDTVKRILHNRSSLFYGESDQHSTSNADWFWNEKENILELRLTWHLLNVSDPSNKFVLDDKEGTPEIEYSETSGFNIYLFETDKKNNLIKTYPANNDPYFFEWKEWSNPDFKTRLKPIYYKFKDLFPELIPLTEKQVTMEDEFSITNYYENKEGAISIIFSGSESSQYEYALPVLEKYYINSTFGLTNDWFKSNSVNSSDGSFQVKKLKTNQIRELLTGGNEIAFELNNNDYHNNFEIKKIKQEFVEKFAEKIETIIVNSNLTNFDIDKLWGEFYFRVNLNENNNYRVINFDKDISLKDLHAKINSQKNKYSIVLFNHIYKEDSKEFKIFEEENQSVITPQQFDNTVRLIRNSNYWISTISKINKYIKEKNESRIKIEKHNNLIFLLVKNYLNKNIYNHPLTIEYKTNNEIIKVNNSASDGTYNIRDNKVYFNIYPDREATIEIIR